MNDRELEKLLSGGTQVSMEVVEIPGPNNTLERVSIERGNFFMLQQVAAQLQQVNIRLEALHQHVRVKEHPRSMGRQTCPVCVALDNAEPLPDPEGDVKADIQAAEESQEGIDSDSPGEV